jgi:hypothetical protein
MKRTMWECRGGHLIEVFGDTDDIQIIVEAYTRFGVRPCCPKCGQVAVRVPEKAGESPDVSVSAKGLWKHDTAAEAAEEKEDDSDRDGAGREQDSDGSGDQDEGRSAGSAG